VCSEELANRLVQSIMKMGNVESLLLCLKPVLHVLMDIIPCRKPFIRCDRLVIDLKLFLRSKK
jgi:hypothetical protein